MSLFYLWGGGKELLNGPWWGGGDEGETVLVSFP